jgi:hypothetical protein
LFLLNETDCISKGECRSTEAGELPRQTSLEMQELVQKEVIVHISRDKMIDG